MPAAVVAARALVTALALMALAAAGAGAGAARRASWSADGAVREWHLHVYWFASDAASVAAAERLRAEVVERVRRRELVAVCAGVTRAMVPRLNESAVPPVNYGPVGPHPVASFETWVSREHLAAALSLFTTRRGDLSVLLHPLTPDMLLDHTADAMWLGERLRLNLGPFRQGEHHDAPQYPELGLGYSAKDGDAESLQGELDEAEPL